jgi:hypothetical protein
MSSMKLIARQDVWQLLLSHHKIHRSRLRKKTLIAFSLFSSEQAHFEILDEAQITADFQV